MIKILAIDDNRDNLTILKAIVGDVLPDSILYTAPDGTAGIKLAVTHDPDVILLDIIMPGMDGFEVCQLLKQEESTRNIPVVFLTSLKGDKESRLKALEVGAEGFLHKPIDETELFAQISAMVKIKQAINQKQEENERLSMQVAERTHELEKSKASALQLVEELKAENESRKKIEDALRASEELFRNIFEYHTAVKLIIDPDSGNITDANRAAEHFYGWSKEQLKKMNVRDINLQSPEKISQFMKMARIREKDQFEFQHCLADGTIRDVEVFSSIIEVKGKSLLHSIVHDISNRKQAEIAIKVSEARLRRAELASKSGNWEFHLDSQTVFASEGAIKIYGVDKNHLKFEDIKTFPLPEYRGLLDMSLRRLIEEGRPYDIEFKIKTFDKGEIKDIHSVAHYDKEKGILFGIIQDISERKKAEEALKESEALLRELNATKDKFFSIIAHDLKSPFNSILGFSNLLISQIQKKDFDRIENQATLIYESAKRTMDLVVNLLDWSRSQIGRMEFNPELFEIEMLVDEAVEIYGDAAHQKSINIITNIPQKTFVFADIAMISTTLRNLISNAVKFTKPRGEVFISALQKSDEIEIIVKDNGIGIKKDAVGKLFRIGESISTLGTKNEKGTGLGLILCKEFIEKHGGRIWVESKLGKGSTFGFTIPNHH